MHKELSIVRGWWGYLDIFEGTYMFTVIATFIPFEKMVLKLIVI